MPTNGEPTYIIAANIRRYERMLEEPGTLPETREVLIKLLAEARASLDKIAKNEKAAVGRSTMRSAVVVGIVVMALSPGFARATDKADFDLKTTEDLYRVCSVGPSDPLREEALNFCEGFLLGVVSYHDEITDRKNLKRLICYPPTATRDQGIQAFNDWAARHQQDEKFMSDPPVVGAVRGLAAKWPCK
jgi:hypothetical protein